MNHASCIMNREEAFTLIEVVASLIIIGVALVAILGMFYVGSKTGKMNEDRLIAYNLLQRKMEEVRAKSFTNIAGAINQNYSGFTDYTLDTTVTNISSNLKKVEVSVEWLDVFGRTRVETIATKLTNQERDVVVKESGKGVAMERIISDLRYAVSISSFRQTTLEFDTVYLENEDNNTETIRYYKSGSSLYRSVGGQATPPEIAGYIDDFDITLHSAGGQQTIHATQAASARIDLTLVNGDETFTLTSGAHMRYYGD
jgi:type II secretory pathway pseudopilin PulG